MKTFYIENDVLKMHGPLEPKSEAEAIELSIEAWELRQKWHEENPHKYLVEGQKATASCGLCSYHSCDTCPLAKAHRACDAGAGTLWRNYALNPSAATAAAMVEALKSLRPDWVKRLVEGPRWKLIGIDWAKGDTDVVVEPLVYGEDWKLQPEDVHNIYTRDGTHIGTIDVGMLWYGNRMLACVNACRGIPNEELEKGVDTLDRLQAAMNKTVGCRLELLPNAYKAKLIGFDEKVKKIIEADNSVEFLRQLEEYVEKKK